MNYVLEMRLELPDEALTVQLEQSIRGALYDAGVDLAEVEVRLHADDYKVVWNVKDVDLNQPSPAQKGFFDTLRKRLATAAMYGDDDTKVAARGLLKEVSELQTTGQLTRQVMSPAIDAMKDCLDDLAFARKHKE